MKHFLQKHDKDITGAISGWDRIAWRGTVRWLSSVSGLYSYLQCNDILLKDFKGWAIDLTDKVRRSCDALADIWGIRKQYLRSSAIDKEALARQIAKEDGIETGPICMFSIVEPCWSPWVYPNKETKQLEISMRPRKCVWIYFYETDEKTGFGHMRIQSWLPFTVKGNSNGRHWLEQQLKAEGIDHTKSENCFRWIEDPFRAQEMMDEQLKTNWNDFLETRRKRYFGELDSLFKDNPLYYYWSADETEWATDIMFKSRQKVDRLFPILSRYGLLTSDSANVMRFMGKIDKDAKIPAGVTRDIKTDRRRRYEGVRSKHNVGRNSIKIYNKAGNVLRTETTINNTRSFKVFRKAEGSQSGKLSWQRMRKGVADLHRRAEVSQKSNERYLEALSACECSKTLLEQIEDICKRTKKDGRSVRALNPWSKKDLKMLTFLAKGEWHINGFRNRDLCGWIYPELCEKSKEQKRRLSSRTSYLIRMLRAHGLVRKVPKENRYVLTKKGHEISTLVSTASHVDSQQLIKMAA